MFWLLTLLVLYVGSGLGGVWWYCPTSYFPCRHKGRSIVLIRKRRKEEFLFLFHSPSLFGQGHHCRSLLIHMAPEYYGIFVFVNILLWRSAKKVFSEPMRTDHPRLKIRTHTYIFSPVFWRYDLIRSSRHVKFSIWHGKWSYVGKRGY